MQLNEAKCKRPLIETKCASKMRSVTKRPCLCIDHIVKSIRKCLFFPSVVQKCTKTSQGHIFHTLQHYSAKLCGFTHFKMLFLAGVTDFVIYCPHKKPSTAGIVCCFRYRIVGQVIHSTYSTHAKYGVRLSLILFNVTFLR